MNVITPSQMYWLTRCDGLYGMAHGMSVLLTILTVIAALFAVVGTVIAIGEDDERLYKLASTLRKITLGLILGAVVFGTAAALTPTTKEMAAILVVPRIANSQTVGDLAGGVVTLAKEWMQELRPKARENRNGSAEAVPEKAERPL